MLARPILRCRRLTSTSRSSRSWARRRTCSSRSRRRKSRWSRCGRRATTGSGRRYSPATSARSSPQRFPKGSGLSQENGSGSRSIPAGSTSSIPRPARRFVPAHSPRRPDAPPWAAPGTEAGAAHFGFVPVYPFSHLCVEGRKEDVAEADLRRAFHVPEREPGDVHRPAVRVQVEVGFGKRAAPSSSTVPNCRVHSRVVSGAYLTRTASNLPTRAPSLPSAEAGDVQVAGIVQLDRGALVVQRRPQLVLPRQGAARVDPGDDEILVSRQRAGESPAEYAATYALPAASAVSPQTSSLAVVPNCCSQTRLPVAS